MKQKRFGSSSIGASKVASRLASTGKNSVSPYGAMFAAIKAKKVRELEGRCELCGAKHANHLDHILPVAQGGKTIWHNMQLICSNCHIKKIGSVNRAGSNLLKGSLKHQQKRRRQSHEKTSSGRETWKDYET